MAGRPTLYDPERHPFLAAVLARDGLTEAEIAQKMGVAMSTVSEWKLKHKEFSEALKGNKPEADARVVNSLYRRALGYEYEETETVYDPQGRPTRVKKTRKVVLPDVTACIFWLKNRQPENWRDNPQGGGNDLEAVKELLSAVAKAGEVWNDKTV